MLASAEPRARFKLVCNRLARAARSAAKPSGINTNAAMIMPTRAFGTLSIRTALSRTGVSDLARPTTATRAARSKPALTSAVFVGGFVCAPSCSDSAGKKIIAMPHRLHENEAAVEHQRHQTVELELRRGEYRAGGGRRHVRQNQRERGQCGKYGQSRARPLDLKSLFAMTRAAPQQARADDAI